MVTALMTNVTLYNRLLLHVLSTSSNVVGMIVLVLALDILTERRLSLVSLPLGRVSSSAGISSRLLIPDSAFLLNAFGLVELTSLAHTLRVTF